jgi:multidrug resistance efflux pump
MTIGNTHILPTEEELTAMRRRLDHSSRTCNTLEALHLTAHVAATELDAAVNTARDLLSDVAIQSRTITQLAEELDSARNELAHYQAISADARDILDRAREATHPNYEAALKAINDACERLDLGWPTF